MAKNVKVEMQPAHVITAKLGIMPGGVVHKYFTERVAIHCDKYVPMDTGALSDYTIEGNKIIYDTPYARYQYYGARDDLTHLIRTANRNRTKHPLATSFWDRNMWTAEKDVVIREVQNYMKSFSKGK